MRVATGLDAIARPPTRAVVTIGMFDGVHRGHQRLIGTAVRLGRRLRGTVIAVTFDPDPQAVLEPSRTPPALMPLEERLAHLAALGVDIAWVLPFTRGFARITAEQFIRRVLVNRLRAVALIVGETFTFGRDRLGDLRLLQRLGRMAGMRIIPVREVARGGRPISSSRIRRLISAGRLAEARRLLGRPPALYGVVVPGAGRGRRLGCPTANIRLIPQVLPPQGVYAVTVRIVGHRPCWGGVMNLGLRPTFGPGPLTCEVHLFGYAGTLRDHPLAVSLLRRLRSERCFPAPSALARQIRRDLARARRLLR